MDDKFVINPDGIKATITWMDDSGSHDSSYYTYTVLVSFSDPSFNPPDGYYANDWYAGEFSKNYKDFRPEMAIDMGRRFYDFLMGLRAPCQAEEQINAIRKRYEEEHENVLAAQRETQDARDELRWAKARIAELESDHIKAVESENATLKKALTAIFNNAHDALLGTAKKR